MGYGVYVKRHGERREERGVSDEKDKKDYRDNSEVGCYLSL